MKYKLIIEITLKDNLKKIVIVNSKTFEEAQERITRYYPESTCKLIELKGGKYDTKLTGITTDVEQYS